MSDLPIQNVLPEVLATLRTGANAIVIAPPGAGKTTMVAPALLREKWCEERVLLLSPRRLAARSAAERMASIAGEKVGQSIGYATRMDSCQSAATRILVLTEGIFRNWIQDDPELNGVSAVLFDEVHERSLDSDFGLALALDVQMALCPDLRLLAMSATVNGARFSALMDNAPVIESKGQAYPLKLRYIGRRAEMRIENDMAAAIRVALAAEKCGDVLAFLPGAREINEIAERLEGIPGISLHRLHGSLEPTEQRRALAPADGTRKIVLATNIAETSLTVPGVRIVVDCGLTRRARYDRAAGVTRLVTEKASQASVMQRAGRAARQEEGVAYRLWEEAANGGLVRFDPPEILESDLSSLLVECKIWGVTDPGQLQWLDPPPVPALDEARKRLIALGALDEEGTVTQHGRAIAKLPLEPRIAHMLLAARDIGLGFIAAEVAVLLSERGLGGGDVDLSLRRQRWYLEKGSRAQNARALAHRWAELAGIDHLEKTPRDQEIGMCLALAFADRISKRRSPDGSGWISAGGRGFRLDPHSSLARADWLAVGEVQGQAAGAHILSAAMLNEAIVEELFAARMVEEQTVRFRRNIGGVEALRKRRLGAIVLSSGNDDRPDPHRMIDALIEGVKASGLELLPWSRSAQSLRRRARFAGIEELSETALMADLDLWLPPLISGKRNLTDISTSALTSVLDMKLGWEGHKRLNKLAPEQLVPPAGPAVAIDYDAPGGPEVTLRVQALFGLKQHPCIGAENLPLRLNLTSPAGRSIQTTGDLPGFWSGNWAHVAREMRGRYPKHHWPEDPASATATLHTKRAAAAAKS